MFDIGFFELLLIAVVALLVIGPERLPTVARTAGMWIGRGRRMLMSVKADIEKELKAEELKRVLEEQARSTGMHEILDDTRSALNDVRQETESVAKSAEKVAQDETSGEPVSQGERIDKP
ncbi:Sec-independent protein translocase protein TatB [Thiolapillus brandeum]|uniref:Sec-independent protein translocase protein TatB n=1 Tax=Thiolapillus brandeum TaxID=1076588 RepID=A0A7U6GHD7_9GAMM|nr:Sec-independent protein translocase protein TatB [Thiolapillus brandeum]BAO43652.1 twin-arginine translocation system component TatB [Thiolapillus brandeum]